jgi:hypothetical protein
MFHELSGLKGQEIISHQLRYCTQGSSGGSEVASELVQKEQVCWPPQQTPQEMHWPQAAILINGSETAQRDSHVRGVNYGSDSHERQVGLACHLGHRATLRIHRYGSVLLEKVEFFHRGGQDGGTLSQGLGMDGKVAAEALVKAVMPGLISYKDTLL